MPVAAVPGSGAPAAASTAAPAATLPNLTSSTGYDATPAATERASTGPAAWDDSWAKKFADAGLPTDSMLQLASTGAMGADAATLEGTLKQLSGEVDATIAQFQAAYPKEFEAIRTFVETKPEQVGPMLGMASSTFTGKQVLYMLAQVATDPATDKKALGDLFFTIESTADMDAHSDPLSMAKMWLAYPVMPGYGFWRMAAAPLTGGRDFFTQEKINLDKRDPMLAMNLAMAAGGLATVANLGVGIRQGMASHALMQVPGSDSATFAARQGVANLSGWEKFKSYVPGNKTYRAVSAVKLMDDAKRGIAGMKPGSFEQKLAQLSYDHALTGRVGLEREGAMRWGKMGFLPNARGVLPMIGNRGKELLTVANTTGTPMLLADLRLSGNASASQFAAAGVHLAEGELKDEIARRLNLDPANVGKLTTEQTKLLRRTVMGEAADQLVSSGHLQKPGVFGTVMGKIRPGPTQDALKAAKEVATHTVGKQGWFAGRSMLGKAGIIGGGIAAAVAGVTLFSMATAPKADPAAAGDAAAAGGAEGAATGGAAAQGQAQGQAATAAAATTAPASATAPAAASTATGTAMPSGVTSRGLGLEG
ncbi:MAG: hypothetical protein JWM90_1249 [Thermoleophilia bacterium]|nr:hypothetical protein [Thermoleophilia bacterium]